MPKRNKQGTDAVGENMYRCIEDAAEGASLLAIHSSQVHGQLQNVQPL